MKLPMLFRFCLYGFLKNQRYFEPFWVLAFLEKGLNFFLLGLLFGFRELATNLMEIPTGAIADVPVVSPSWANRLEDSQARSTSGMNLAEQLFMKMLATHDGAPRIP